MCSTDWGTTASRNSPCYTLRLHQVSIVSQQVNTKRAYVNSVMFMCKRVSCSASLNWDGTRCPKFGHARFRGIWRRCRAKTCFLRLSWPLALPRFAKLLRTWKGALRKSFDQEPKNGGEANWHSRIFEDNSQAFTVWLNATLSFQIWVFMGFL